MPPKGTPGWISVHLDRVLLEREMTLTELATRVGLTQANVSILKTGKAKAIRFSTLAAICDVLQCEPGDLLRYEHSNGGATVALLDVGESKLRVVKVLRELTGASLDEAKTMLDQAPGSVATGLSRYEAESAMVKLRAAGATAEVND